MFKTCAIAADDEETRTEGCLRLAKALREVVVAEQDLQAKNAAYESGVVGKAIVSHNTTRHPFLVLARTRMHFTNVSSNGTAH